MDEPSVGERLLRTYVKGWMERAPVKVHGTLDPECVVVESHRPVYRDTDRVAKWIDAWFGEGNSIEGWDITGLGVTAEAAAMEWRFTCTWHGRPASFEGASVARFSLCTGAIGLAPRVPTVSTALGINAPVASPIEVRTE